MSLRQGLLSRSSGKNFNRGSFHYEALSLGLTFGFESLVSQKGLPSAEFPKFILFAFAFNFFSNSSSSPSNSDSQVAFIIGRDGTLWSLLIGLCPKSRGAVLGWLVTAGAVPSPESAEAET